MMRSFRWLQSRLARTGATLVLFGAVGCTPTNSSVNRNGTPPPRTMTGIGANTPTWANGQVGNPGSNPSFLRNQASPSNIAGTPPNQVADPRMTSTPGAAGPQLQQTGFNPNGQAGVTNQQLQPPLINQTVPQQNVNQANYPPSGYQQGPGVQPIQAQVPQYVPPQQPPQFQPQTVPAYAPGYSPMQLNQGAQGRPLTQAPAMRPELQAPTLTTLPLPPTSSQGVQQASYNVTLPPVEQPTATTSAPTNAGKVLYSSTEGRIGAPPPVTSASSDLNAIPPAGVMQSPLILPRGN